MVFDKKQILIHIRQALLEDLGSRDVTSEALFSLKDFGEGHLKAKEHAVIAGLGVCQWVYKSLDPQKIKFKFYVKDGQRVRKDTVLGVFQGPVRTLLAGERVALNYLQRMSGIATLTRHCVERTQGTACKILDTRKTAPGLRVFDKWAVHLGGGVNHREGLFDAVMIKDNHLQALISIKGYGMKEAIREALECVQQKHGNRMFTEIEVKTVEGLEAVLSLQESRSKKYFRIPNRILLDNMILPDIRKAVRLTQKRIALEVSGGVTLDRIASLAKTDVEFISMGALTHSVKAVDIHFKLR
ncbi:MAG: carboxylating nicotinate-nucleotide diphosphorylase [Deltaproteobacteria bacterium]|nr:carboxylating nicotinate-nucleotide diphosphorylase [Deltaproteobacteria bacterium]